VTGPPDLPAGDFSAWLRAMRESLAGTADSDVPCGGCCACCASSHFIHVGPDEDGALAHIPPALLFTAPGFSAGHVVMGYDQRGRCPMLAEDGRCGIYDHRPRTCRVYDCRVFAAAGIAADSAEIARRARRWAFAYPGQRDCEEHDAVRAAARFVRERAGCFPSGAVPRDSAQVAVLAVEASDVFLGRAGEAADAAGGAGTTARATRDSGDGRQIAGAIIEACRRFETP
jgi:Fe-S-cluster containining protein